MCKLTNLIVSGSYFSRYIVINKIKCVTSGKILTLCNFVGVIRNWQVGSLPVNAGAFILALMAGTRQADTGRQTYRQSTMRNAAFETQRAA